ncbi:MAG TPA: ribosome assembly cofactor RimP [Bacteroidales bacterium]
MINEKLISNIIQLAIGGTDKFLVEVKVRTGNRIMVFVDSDTLLTIADCAGLSKFIESHLNRESEDFELSVSSPGIDMPYRNVRQYLKNTGREVSVITNDGIKRIGTLIAADQQGMELLEVTKMKKVVTELRHRIKYTDIKETKEIIKF